MSGQGPSRPEHEREEERPTVAGLTRQIAGPLVVLAAVAFLVASALLAIGGQDDIRRPELQAFSAPEGATVRYVDERCPSPHLGDGPGLAEGEGTTICDVVLAIGPLEGLWIPEPTEDLLLTHLVERGWSGDPAGLGRWLDGPNGLLAARVESYDDVASRDPDLAEAIADGVRSHVDVEGLAVVVILPTA